MTAVRAVLGGPRKGRGPAGEDPVEAAWAMPPAPPADPCGRPG
jgi:hypothetical protein